MSEQRPTTFFSGKSNPNSDDAFGPGLGAAKPVALVVAAVFATVAVAVGMVTYLTFQIGRVSYRVLWAVTGVYAAALFIVKGFSQASLLNYLRPWRDLYWQVQKDGFTGLTVDFGGILLAQAPLGILLGLIGGSLAASWRWYRRPVWEQHDLRATPWEVRRRRRTAALIAADLDGPVDGVTIGMTSDGRRLVQTDAEASAHTLVVGGSGAGKTRTMLTGLRDTIRRGHGVVFVDLKGAADVPEILAEYAARYDRRFLHFKIQDSRLPYHGAADGPAFYDPAGRGDPSRRKDLLIGAKKWDVDYYKQIVGNYLQTAFGVAEIVRPVDGTGTFDDLVSLLQPELLAQRAAYIPRNHPDAAKIAAEVQAFLTESEAQERSGIRSMRAYIQTFVGSTAGAWLRRDPTGQRDIDLRKAADNGWVVVFSLDSSNYEESSAAIAGLIIQDLKTLSSELRARPAAQPFRVVVDEFQAIGSDNVVGLVNKARDSNLPITLATQALGDLKKVDEAFADQIIGIVNCFIIHRANHPTDAELYAGLTGKAPRFKKRTDVEKKSSMWGFTGLGSATGSGMIEEYDEYRVLPREIQDLQPGQVVYIAKSPTSRVQYPVRVILEDPAAVARRGNGAATSAAPVRYGDEPVTTDAVGSARNTAPAAPYTAPAASPDTGGLLDAVHRHTRHPAPPAPTGPTAAGPPTAAVPTARPGWADTLPDYQPTATAPLPAAAPALPTRPTAPAPAPAQHTPTSAPATSTPATSTEQARPGPRLPTRPPTTPTPATPTAPPRTTPNPTARGRAPLPAPAARRHPRPSPAPPSPATTPATTPANPDADIAARLGVPEITPQPPH